MKDNVLIRKIIVIIVVELVCLAAVLYPHPFLANFIVSTLSDVIFAVWVPTHEIPDINPIRIALTPLGLVSIAIFVILQKLSMVCKRYNLSTLKTISRISGWFCIIATCTILLMLWYDLKIVSSEEGCGFILGHLYGQTVSY